MPASQMLNGENGRSTQANDATIGDTDIAPLGINPAAEHLKSNKKSDSGSGYKCEGKKLAQQTVVCPRRYLRQVAVTTVMHAICAVCCYGFTRFVDVNRRQHQHWHKHSQ